MRISAMLSCWTCRLLVGQHSVSSWTLTLIEREDDTRSWGNFSGLFLTRCHTNLRGLGLHIYSWPRQPAYAKMLV
jgi:hypothetical protein